MFTHKYPANRNKITASNFTQAGGRKMQLSRIEWEPHIRPLVNQPRGTPFSPLLYPPPFHLISESEGGKQMRRGPMFVNSLEFANVLPIHKYWVDFFQHCGILILAKAKHSNEEQVMRSSHWASTSSDNLSHPLSFKIPIPLTSQNKNPVIY